MKTCVNCGRAQPLDAFYRHRNMADGFLNQCKNCARAKNRANRAARVDYYRAYDRDRASEQHRKANAKRVVKRWRRADPRRQVAHAAAARASGPAPPYCSMCGCSDKPLQKHHPTYDQPTLVTWVCKPCHVVADEMRRRAERKGRVA